MKRSKNRLITAVVIVAIIGLGALVVNIDHGTSSTGQPSTASRTAKPPTVGRTDITYVARPGITSLQQLKAEARDVVTTTSKYGVLVSSIEGHASGTDGKYWSFYVNNKMAQVGAGSYIQQKGDVIEWKFQKL